MTTVLEEAADIIDGARNATYGDAADEFENVAKAWSAYKGVEITALDYANMMMILKIMRARHGWYRDSYVDTCGYAALAERVNDKAEAKDEPESTLSTITSIADWAGQTIFDVSRWALPNLCYSQGGPIGTVLSGLITPPETAVSLTEALRDWQWQVTGQHSFALIYAFVDGEWWYRNPSDDAEDPWVLSVHTSGDVPAFEGPFALYTE